MRRASFLHASTTAAAALALAASCSSGGPVITDVDGGLDANITDPLDGAAGDGSLDGATEAALDATPDVAVPYCDDPPKSDGGTDAGTDAGADAQVDAGNCQPACVAPYTCGGGGQPDVCGCTKITCAGRQKDCGLISDGCGGTAYCGDCGTSATCGALCSNVCSCVPKKCADLKKNCGSVPDGCGGTLDCGSCVAPQGCRSNNVCGLADNVVIVGNYDGGALTVDVDQNLPNIGIGLISINAMTVTITGAYAANVVAVHHVGSAAGTTVTGVAANKVTTAQSPPATLVDPPGSNTMICHYGGGAAYGGSSCNTRAQARDYFTSKLGGQVATHRCQYSAYGAPVTVSSGDACTCTPFTCEQLGKNCGSVPDGCGGMLACGTCAVGACGAFGQPNVCGACPPGQTFAGPRNPATMVNQAGIGSRAWQNTDKGRVSDTVVANVSAMVGGQISNYLKGTDFGFAVPPTAIIRGVYVEWNKSALSGGTLVDHAVRLVVGGAIGATDRSKPGAWPRLGSSSQTLDGRVLYGGAGDLWGEASLTPLVVNDPSFGAAIATRYTSVSGNDWPHVDGLRMFVCYE